MSGILDYQLKIATNAYLLGTTCRLLPNKIVIIYRLPYVKKFYKECNC